MGKKKASRAKAGWRVGTVEDFLSLTPEESALIELALVLSGELRKRRPPARDERDGQ